MSVGKRCNVEHHFTKVHSNFSWDFLGGAMGNIGDMGRKSFWCALEAIFICIKVFPFTPSDFVSIMPRLAITTLAYVLVSGR